MRGTIFESGPHRFALVLRSDESCLFRGFRLQRLLAYHTVENIGIIFIGLGLALAFRADGMKLAAALALTAALFHV